MWSELIALEAEKLALLIPILGGVGGFVTAVLIVAAVQWRMVRHAEIEATLKSQMLEQEMSAEEIERVLQAGLTIGGRRHSRRVRTAKF